MPGRVFVTGGSGFVGSAVIEELLARGYAVNALTHRRRPPAEAGVNVIEGDLFDPRTLAEGMAGCEAMIHLVGIIFERPSRGVTFERIHFEGTRSVVDAARGAGVKRYLHMSALGARVDAVSRYHKTKYMAEEYVRGSGLEWTIFRPSLIHGPTGEFMRMEIAWAKKKEAPPFMFMPYFGRGLLGRGGGGQIQPVYVGDVARAFVDALENPKTVGEVYLSGGPEAMTWPAMHQTVAEAVVGHRRWVMAVPAWYARLVASVTPAALLPFNRDQVIMSQEESTCDLTKFVDDFGWQPREFGETVRGYVKRKT